MCIYPCIDEHIGKLEKPIKYKFQNTKSRTKSNSCMILFHTVVHSSGNFGNYSFRSCQFGRDVQMRGCCNQLSLSFKKQIKKEVKRDWWRKPVTGKWDQI